MKTAHPKPVRSVSFVWALVLLFCAWLPVAADDHRRTVVDPVGRQMRIAINPQKIVALAPSVTEILFALGAGDRVVGVTRFSDYPPKVRALPKVGSYVHLDAERIVALAPDLCIGIKDGNPLNVVQQIQAMGVPVFAVHPLNLESTMQSILAIGNLVNAADRANAIVDDMRRRIARVQQRAAMAEGKPRVFVQIGVSPIVSAGTNTFINELIELAGGTNSAAGTRGYPRFSREQVISMAPDVMVISSMARETVFERVKREWMAWPAIPAVKNRALYIAPTNLFDRPTPRLVDGLEVMAGYIHPSLFKAAP